MPSFAHGPFDMETNDAHDQFNHYKMKAARGSRPSTPVPASPTFTGKNNSGMPFIRASPSPQAYRSARPGSPSPQAYRSSRPGPASPAQASPRASSRTRPGSPRTPVAVFTSTPEAPFRFAEDEVSRRGRIRQRNGSAGSAGTTGSVSSVNSVASSMRSSWTRARSGSAKAAEKVRAGREVARTCAQTAKLGEDARARRMREEYEATRLQHERKVAADRERELAKERGPGKFLEHFDIEKDPKCPQPKLRPGESAGMAIAKALDPLRPAKRADSTSSDMSFMDIAPKHAMEKCKRCAMPPRKILKVGVCEVCLMELKNAGKR